MSRVEKLFSGLLSLHNFVTRTVLLCFKPRHSETVVFEVFGRRWWRGSCGRMRTAGWAVCDSAAKWFHIPWSEDEPWLCCGGRSMALGALRVAEHSRVP